MLLNRCFCYFAPNTDRNLYRIYGCVQLWVFGLRKVDIFGSNTFLKFVAKFAFKGDILKKQPEQRMISCFDVSWKVIILTGDFAVNMNMFKEVSYDEEYISIALVAVFFSTSLARAHSL
jgi:hypothetical protein